MAVNLLYVLHCWILFEDGQPRRKMKLCLDFQLDAASHISAPEPAEIFARTNNKQPVDNRPQDVL